MKNKLLVAGMLGVSLTFGLVLAGCASAPVDLAGRQAHLQKNGSVDPTIGKDASGKETAALSLTVWAAMGTDANGDPEYIEFVDDTTGKFHATWGDAGTAFTYTVTRANTDNKDAEGRPQHDTIDGEIDGKPFAIEDMREGIGNVGVYKLTMGSSTYILGTSARFTDPNNLYSAARGSARQAMEAALKPANNAFAARYGAAGLPAELQDTGWTNESAKVGEVQSIRFFTSDRDFPIVIKKIQQQQSVSSNDGSFRDCFTLGNTISAGSGSTVGNVLSLAAGKQPAMGEYYNYYNEKSGAKMIVFAPNCSFQYSCNGTTLKITKATGDASILVGTYTLNENLRNLF